MKVSACIIAKNEEKNLPRLLESIKGKFDEIIVVDTGSTDKTIEIAKKYGCKVYEKEWSGFADARNYAVSKASGDWIWHFDADFELEDKEFERFQRIVSLIYKDETFDGINVVYQNINEYGEIKSLSSTVHIHRNISKIKWIGKVHERIQNINKKQVVTPPYSVFVKHYGYSVASIQEEKAKRNLSLILDEIQNLDMDSDEYLIKLFYLVQSYLALSYFEKHYLESVVHYSMKFLDIYKKIKYRTSLENSIFHKHIYVYIGTALEKLGKIEMSEKYITQGLSIDSDYLDLIYLKGIILENKGEKYKSLETFLRFIYLSDKISLEDVKYSSIVSDFISQTKNLILGKFAGICDNTLLEKAEYYWKKTKTENVGLVYYFLMRNINQQKAFSLLKKFVKLYNTDIFFVEYANYISSIEEKIKLLQKGFEKNPNSKFINKYIGDIFFEKKDYQKALKHYKKYFDVSKDISILPILKEILENLGFNKEAEKIVYST